jgi:hypothetical protein
MVDNSTNLFRAVFVLIWPHFVEKQASVSSTLAPFWRFISLFTKVRRLKMSPKTASLWLGELSTISNRSTPQRSSGNVLLKKGNDVPFSSPCQKGHMLLLTKIMSGSGLGPR